MEAGSALSSLPTFQATFPHRTFTNPNTSSSREAEEDNDFLSLMTCVAVLYGQEGVLKMKERGKYDGGKVSGTGATSAVITISASFTQPSDRDFYRTDDTELTVVLKKYSAGLFESDGHPRDPAMARSFVSEMKILCHPRMRESPHIVTLLGLHWDVTVPTSPDPVIVLEHAHCDLNDFLVKNRYLPFRTKTDLALDIACGLATLHSYGVIHGDMKPENILIFNNGRYRAKIADFGHSMFDTGEVRNLIGRTPMFAAPEWEKPMTTAKLKLTDVFSFGLVFASIIYGPHILRDIVRKHNAEYLETLKVNGELFLFFERRLRKLELATVEDPSLVRDILKVTVRTNPDKRDLLKAISQLSLRKPRIPDFKQRHTHVLEYFKQITLAIPYQALEPLGNGIKDQIPRALHHITKSNQDYRYAAACWDLCVCYCSDFGLPRTGVNDNESFGNNAARYLIESAKSGDQGALLAIVPVFRSLAKELPFDELPIVARLQSIAIKGSGIAISQLQDLAPKEASDCLQSFQNAVYHGDIIFSAENDSEPGRLASNGDSILHWASSTGNFELLKKHLELPSAASEINRQNLRGESPLLQAARAGRIKSIELLVKYGADGSLLSSARESPIHFLAVFSKDDVKKVAYDLGAAGALVCLQTISLEATFDTFYDLMPIGPGTPAYRATLAGNVHALSVLLELEHGTNDKGLHTSPSMLGQLLAYAVKMRHCDIIELLISKLSEFQGSSSIQVWDNGQLLSIRELWLLGYVSTNRSSGFDWPEKFSRVMCFGALSTEVLDRSFHLLNSNGYLSGAYSYHIDMAIRSSRRDAVRCLIPFLMSAGPPRREDRYGSNEHTEPELITDFPLCECPASRPVSASGSWSEGTSEVLEPDTAAVFFQNHQYSGMLAECVECAIDNAERAIFQDLLDYGNGLALFPGVKICLAVSQETYKSHPRDCKLSNGASLFPPDLAWYFVCREHTMGSSCSIDHFDGTVNYLRLYMNQIAMSKHRDMSMPNILLKTALRRVPGTALRWKPNHWFEDRCLGFSDHEKSTLICPLYHSAVRRWNKLTVLLLNHGASLQDAIAYNDKSVLSHILTTKYAALASLISNASDFSSAEILRLQDLQDILLHSYHEYILWKSQHLFTLTINWVLVDGRCKLTWIKSYEERMNETKLWSAIATVVQKQSHRLKVRVRPSYLITLAVMQQNVAAVECLLAIGLRPVIMPSDHPQILSTATAFINWTAKVPDADCTNSALELKKHHLKLSELLTTEHAVEQPHSLIKLFAISNIILGSLIRLISFSEWILTILTLLPALALAALPLYGQIKFYLQNEDHIVAIIVASVVFDPPFWILLTVSRYNLMTALKVLSDPIWKSNKVLLNHNSIIAAIGFGGSKAALYSSQSGYLNGHISRYLRWWHKGWVDRQKLVDPGSEDEYRTEYMPSEESLLAVRKNVEILISLEEQLIKADPELLILSMSRNHRYSLLQRCAIYWSGDSKHHVPPRIQLQEGEGPSAESTDSVEESTDDTVEHDQSSGQECSPASKSYMSQVQTAAAAGHRLGSFVGNMVISRIVPVVVLPAKMAIKVADLFNERDRIRMMRRHAGQAYPEDVHLLSDYDG